MFSEFKSNITDTFRELLPNNATHFSRYQSNTDIFRKLPANNTIDFSRAYIKQN